MNYAALKARLVPQLRFSQEIYEDVLDECISEDTVWVDAGCGWHLLPPWRAAQERRLVERGRLVVGCDLDEASIRRHRSMTRLVVADLERLPFRSGSVSLITSNMVLEHLQRPLTVFSEFARVLKEGGRVIVHTPNAHSHFVLVGRLLPRRLRLRLVRRLDGRPAEDVFPAHYRTNTPGRLRSTMAKAGLLEEWCRMVASDSIFSLAYPMLAALELLYIRLTLRPAFRRLRVTIIACFANHGGSVASAGPSSRL